LSKTAVGSGRAICAIFFSITPHAHVRACACARIIKTKKKIAKIAQPVRTQVATAAYDVQSLKNRLHEIAKIAQFYWSYDNRNAHL
jgi:hypothetical protein